MLYGLAQKRVLERYGVSKEARHAADRLKERTSLDPKVLAELDAIAAKLTKDKVPAGFYHLPLPRNQGTAAFKTVGPKDKLVLSTILAPGMKPRGSSLSHLAAVKQADEATGPEIPGDLQNRWDTLKHLVGRRGVFAGTAHRRITIPKNVLSEGDIKTLGFEPVLMAIPEAGQGRFTSYRHPDNTYHIHSHGERWTMHKDRHPAATMMARHMGRFEAAVKGAPHVVTEGLPGLYYYAKGQMLGRGSTADEVETRLKPDVKELINALAQKTAGKHCDKCGKHITDWRTEPPLCYECAGMPKLEKYKRGTGAEKVAARPEWTAERINAAVGRYDGTSLEPHDLETMKQDFRSRLRFDHDEVPVPLKTRLESYKHWKATGQLPNIETLPGRVGEMVKFKINPHRSVNYVQSDEPRELLTGGSSVGLTRSFQQQGRTRFNYNFVRPGSTTASYAGTYAYPSNTPGVERALRPYVGRGPGTPDVMRWSLPAKYTATAGGEVMVPNRLPRLAGKFLSGLKLGALTTELEPHQQRIVDRMADPEQRGLIAAHPLGSGKTLSAIAAAQRLGMPADIVVPASLRANFQKELAKHTNAPLPMNLQSVQAIARNRGESLHAPLMIVDEAHRTRNPTKTQSALMRSPALKRLLLTGSLFYNEPSDVAGPVNIVAGRHTLPAKKTEFDQKFLRERTNYKSVIDRVLGRNGERVTELNPKTKGLLQGILKKYVDYYPGSDEHFPARTDETVRVPMNSKQLQVYDTVMGQAPAWVRHRVRSGMPPSKQEAHQLNAFLAGARQVSNTTAPYQETGAVAEPKIDAAVKELQKVLDQNPRAKALVYSNYLDAGVNPYKHKLEALGVPFGEFTGEMPKRQRAQLVQDYNADKIKALLLSPAGGEGLDLQGTRLIQILEPHWNEERLKQVIGRGIRYKSHGHLPEDERNVHVQRFLSVHPKRGLLKRVFTRDPGRSVDEYLQSMAANKERLNEQFRGLLEEKTAAYTEEAMLPKLDLSKFARRDDDDESHAVRNTLMAGAAAAPFAGLIGQKPMIHLDKGDQVADFNKFKNLIQPGDIVLNGDSKMTFNKGLISAITGTPKGYHVAVGDGSNGVYEVGANYRFQPSYNKNEHYQILRPKDPATAKRLQGQSSTLDDWFKLYGRGVQKNLRQGGMGRAAAGEATGRALDKAYWGPSKAMPLGLKELFMPKLRSDAAIETERANTIRQRGKLWYDKPLAAEAKNTAKQVMANPSARGVCPPDAVSGVCSTIPASMMPKGKPVVPGKLPSEVMPSDFLRSEHFSPVARYSPKGARPLSEGVLRAAPWLTRAGLGLAGAGAVYGLSRLFRGQKKRPQEQGAPVAQPATANI